MLHCVVSTDGAASPTLVYVKGLSHMIAVLATALRAQKFRFRGPAVQSVAFVRIILSSVRSDTARSSRWLSATSSFSRMS
jgi:hypothetical protein